MQTQNSTDLNLSDDNLLPRKCSCWLSSRSGFLANFFPGMPCRKRGHLSEASWHSQPGWGLQSPTPHRDPGGIHSPELPTVALGNAVLEQMSWAASLRAPGSVRAHLHQHRGTGTAALARASAASVMGLLSHLQCQHFQQDLYLSIGSLFHHSNIIMC